MGGSDLTRIIEEEGIQMKNEHMDLLTGILIGTVIGGVYSVHLATVLPILLGTLAVVFGLKFLGMLR